LNGTATTPIFPESDDSYGDLTGLPDGISGDMYRYGGFPGGATGLDGLEEPSSKHKPNGWGVVLPLLLVTFFCCFVFQTYQKNANRGGRGLRTSTHESEGINLVETYSNARKWASNRAADAFDRRRDQWLAAHDFSRNNNDPDEDTML
jgi:hypothetical protein